MPATISFLTVHSKRYTRPKKNLFFIW